MTLSAGCSTGAIQKPGLPANAAESISPWELLGIVLLGAAEGPAIKTGPELHVPWRRGVDLNIRSSGYQPKAPNRASSGRVEEQGVLTSSENSKQSVPSDSAGDEPECTARSPPECLGARPEDRDPGVMDTNTRLEAWYPGPPLRTVRSLLRG